MSYMPQIMNDVGCTTYEEMKRKTEAKVEWRPAANQTQKTNDS